MSFIPSLEQVNKVFNVLNQVTHAVQTAWISGFRGWRIWQTWNDPNLSKIAKTFYIAVDGAGIATDATMLANTCHPILDDKDVETLSNVSSSAILGADVIRIMNDENRTADNLAIVGTQLLLRANQIAGGGQTLYQVINFGGTIALCYTKKEWLKKQLKTLMRATRQSYPESRDTVKDETIQRNAEAAYQAQILQAKKDHGEQKNSEEVLKKVEELIEDALVLTRAHIQENKCITRKRDIVELKKIPSVLRERKEFASRKCRISNYPIHTVVTITDPDSKNLIHYDLRNLEIIWQKGGKLLPIDWPQALPFSRELFQVDQKETERIANALKQAVLEPEIRNRAELKLSQYKKLEKHYEKMLKLCEKDIKALDLSNTN